MLYNKNNFPQYVETAGKITIITALSGILVFAFIFIFNIGKTELEKAEAQTSTATTTLTVLNTPPDWVAGLEGREEFESSTSSPTNSGQTVSWIGTASDANGAPYFLIVCEGSATPTAQQSTSTLGTRPPICSSGTQWAVSTGTLSGQQARAATTTTEVAPFSESNVWYAWVCDDDPINPRCSTTFSQGTTATNSSPFNVNRRPVFTAFGNLGGADPGQNIVFISTSSDPDTVDAEDEIFLIVCDSPTYSTTTNECGPGDFIASTTIGVLSDATATYTLPAIIQDTNYNAYGYIYDEHGHSATGATQGSNVQFTVNNVAPTVSGSSISLNGGLDIILTNPGSETTGFTLSFIAADANSCDAIGGGPADEIDDYIVSVLRSGIGTSTCDGSAGSYNANNCYASGVGSSVWNLSCTASSTSCLGASDDTIQYDCTFPLWFIADPTQGTSTQTPYFDQNWVAGVAAIDDDNATGSMSTSTSGVELFALVAIDLLNNLIAYDQLEPGDQMTNLTASTTMQVLGNTGINQLLGGDSMCGTYTPLTGCPNAASSTASSTIRQDYQRYATSTVSFASGTQLQPTSTPALLDIRIPKPTSTSTASTRVTYWGIEVPDTISLAGTYTGQNIFIGTVSSPATW